MWRLENTEGVRSAHLHGQRVKRVIKGMNEGGPSEWRPCRATPDILNNSIARADGLRATPTARWRRYWCSLTTTKGRHPQSALSGVVQGFAADNKGRPGFILAAGNAGIGQPPTR